MVSTRERHSMLRRPDRKDGRRQGTECPARHRACSSLWIVAVLSLISLSPLQGATHKHRPSIQDKTSRGARRLTLRDGLSAGFDFESTGAEAIHFAGGTGVTETITQVSAGYAHSCGVKTDGTLACWGSNASGQVAPSGGLPVGAFAQVSAGYAHS